ncbi:unnamed protein product [Citrullus colocynthis]|uniref:Uncharacterized protein n=1 Tax=Citrullus colocynthis TaxID=252529 RepID=A0ABP0Z3E2_9ROSI
MRQSLPGSEAEATTFLWSFLGVGLDSNFPHHSFFVAFGSFSSTLLIGFFQRFLLLPIEGAIIDAKFGVGNNGSTSGTRDEVAD